MADPIAVGTACPDMAVTIQDGSSVTLSDLWSAGAGGLIIFFYPKADTGGWTKQACGFRDNYDAFTGAGYAILGCSKDDPALQSMWKDKQSFPYNLACDQSAELCGAVGMLKDGGGVKRGNVVIGADGVVKQSGLFSPQESVAAALELLA
jgi:peroxiredoxin Q/BCP